MFSGLYLAASVWLVRQKTCRPVPTDSIPESGPCVSLQFPGLANTFLGESSPAHGDCCGSVSEGGQVSCWGHLVEGTLHLQWTPGKELQATTLLLKSPNGEQSSLCQREENSNRMDFQAVARLYCVRAPRKENANFSPYDWYPGGLPG